jgi:HSP20 family molecular chaperone IbpA
MKKKENVPPKSNKTPANTAKTTQNVPKVNTKVIANHEKSPEATQTSEGRIFFERSPIHLKDNGDFSTIALDVAGFKAEDFEVRVDDHVVTIFAKRVNKLGDTYVIRRQFRLDEKTTNEEKIQVNLTDGILEIVIPKKPKAEPRTIRITTNSQPVVAAVVATSTTPEVIKSSTETEEATEATHEDEDASAAEEEKDLAVARDFVQVETVNEEEEDDDDKEEKEQE